MDEKLLEPLRYYNSTLQKSHGKAIEDYFNNLVSSANINIEANRLSVKHYKQKLKEVDNFSKRLIAFKVLRVIAFIIAVACGYGIYLYFTQQSSQNLLIMLGCIVAILVIIFLIFKKLNPTIKDVAKAKTELEYKANQIKDECYNQLSMLNRSYDSDDARKLIMTSLPDIIVDKHFDIERFEYLNEKYHLSENDNTNLSTIDILSGEIVGNPYLIVKYLKHEIIDYEYTGTRTITWTTDEIDSDGNHYTQSHTDTLVARIIRPKPEYSEFTSLVYGNDAAENLIFNRKPGHINRLSEGQIERAVRKGSKKLLKLSEESLANGGKFTPIGNDEFDVLFNALDRNNETQFRLLFTPLAQKNMLDLMKDDKYGDDFHFNKRNNLNYITSNHTLNWDLDTRSSRFINYDIDDAKQKFIAFHTQYFDHFYFQLAPILSIPLYQHQKPQEYIYKHKFKHNFTSYESELTANLMGAKKFAHDESDTTIILKTKPVGIDGNTDTIEVTAHSYKAVSRRTYVSVYGGDGRYHDVPVDWIEYIPLTATSYMKIKDTRMSEKNYKSFTQSSDFKNLMKRNNGSHYVYNDGLLGIIISGNGIRNNIDRELESLINTL